MGVEIVVIGADLGGLKSLQELLWGIRADFPLPLVIVQHRRRDSELGLCEFLRQHSRLPLREVEDKEAILPGHAYLAPRDYHLLIEKKSFALSIERPVSFARPAIDVLFESAADAFGRDAIGVLLSRSKRDGVRGLEAIRNHGGLALASEDETLERAADGLDVDHVVPVSRMASLMVSLVSPAAIRYGT